MKKIITITAIVMVSLANAQAYKGKGDIKAQVGLNTQSHGTGINLSTDFGLGENMSYGFVASYLLSVDEVAGEKPNFDDRADFKVRFNANIGNVFKLDKAMDIYPGLNLGTRNFGAHLGFRYFFTEGFGVYTEAGIPLAKYDTNAEGFEKYNNQFVFQIGASFNL
ncbi:hypothetical protein L1S35_09295 [Flavobacterium sp. AS60]|uniref:DUF6646 family protein n=1 Tax=Flavobacterium anseongense TaxID=2910677 RepID=UPI001F28BFA6|nr:DUF6646 family protein [Flavobacterium sp. AS60]MCF6129869.1 hypothetical protein [Flavobacterium sp. AS60]